MIQAQVLNYLMQSKDVEMLQTFGKEYFSEYPKQYEWIYNHYVKYRVIPDTASFVGQFGNNADDEDGMPIIPEVRENPEYLKASLRDEYVTRRTTDAINESSEEFGTIGGDAAKEKLINKLHVIGTMSFDEGVDIIKDAPRRAEILAEKINHPEQHTFHISLTELDDALGGIRRGEEFIVLYARTNNLKSFLAQKLGVDIWALGFNVGMFSPEMSATEIGYRFDTLWKGLNNRGITGGDPTFDVDKYAQWTKELAKGNFPAFDVRTPLNFNERRVTVSALRRWVIQKKLDVLVLDGLSYLTNERTNRSKSTTENLTDIAEDLMTLSIEMKIPIIGVMQANRVGARDRDGEVSSESPELDTIRGSDGISHNASRAISIFKAKDVVKLYIAKNRYGEKGQHIYYACNINEGKFAYVANPKDGVVKNTEGNNASVYEDIGEVC